MGVIQYGLRLRVRGHERDFHARFSYNELSAGCLEPLKPRNRHTRTPLGLFYYFSVKEQEKKKNETSDFSEFTSLL